MTLMREITCSASSSPASDPTAVSTPSMRYLMIRPPGVVSRWMSLAAAFSASYTVECTSLTTGLVSSLMVLNDRSAAPLRAPAPRSALGSSPSMACSVSSWRARYAATSAGCARHQLKRAATRCSAQACRSLSNGSPMTSTSASLRSRSGRHSRSSASANGSTSKAGVMRRRSSIAAAG